MTTDDSSLPVITIIFIICILSLLFKFMRVSAMPPGSETLHHVFELGNTIQIEKMLKEKAADLSVKDPKGYTPLHYACENGKLLCLEYVMNSQYVYPPVSKLLRISSGYIFGNTPLTIEDYSGRVILHHACEKGSVQLVEKLLAAGAHPNVSDRYNCTPLHYACKRGNLKIIRALLKRGANPNAVHVSTGTPLHYACKTGNLRLVRTLIGAGADRRGIFGTTLLTVKEYLDKVILHHASEKGSVQLVKKLMEVGAKPNVSDAHNCTPLHYACKGGFVDVVSDLITAGANCRAQDKSGYTPIHYACQNGHLQCLDYLIDHCGPSISKMAFPVSKLLQVSSGYIFGNTPLTIKDDSGKVILHHACEKGSVQLVEKLLAAGAHPNVNDKYNCTPLHYACKRGNLKIICALLKRGANPNAVHVSTGTPLHYACKTGNLHLVQTLIGAGADHSIKRSDGNTPLHDAVEGGFFHCVDSLVNYNPSPGVRLPIIHGILFSRTTPINIGNRCGKRVLHIACMKGSLNMVEKLLDADANPNVLDDDANTPLHNACQGGFVHIVDRLIRKGASCTAKNKLGYIPLHYACSKGYMQCAQRIIADNTSYQLRITTKYMHGDTPLTIKDPTTQKVIFHYACEQGNREVVKMLIKEGADPTVQDFQGFTPLHYAFQNDQWDCASSLVDYCKHKLCQTEVVQFLSQFLLLACKQDDMEVCGKLIGLGSDNLALTDNTGRTPLDYACENKNLPFMHSLIDYYTKITLNDKDKQILQPVVFFAFKEGNIDLLQKLIPMGIDLTVEDANGYSPLHYACKLGHVHCLEHVMNSRNVSNLDELLKMCGRDGNTPLTVKGESDRVILHHACAKGSMKLVDTLISSVLQ